MSPLNSRLLAALVSSAALTASSYASLAVSYQFNGTGNWSIDGWGTGNPANGVSASVPTGSTVVKAFLYSSTWDASTPTVVFDGTTISGASWTAGGITGGSLQAYRADVTAQVAAKIGSGSGSLFNFTLNEGSGSSAIDGEVLAVVYSNPTEQNRTIAFLDGFSATTGDSTALNLANALTTAQLTDPNFEALMSLGIGFGYQGDSQYSTVRVNGTLLTSSAGGSDDGADANGGLITVGGLGDSITNPASASAQPPAVGTRYDDELYSLKPLLSAGLTTITINTLNPSNNDNIFFAGFNITADAGVNQPPPPPANGVPDAASTLGLLAASMGALAALRRRFL